MCPYCEIVGLSSLNGWAYCKKTGRNEPLYSYYCQDSQDCQFCPYLGGDDRIRKEIKAKENSSKSSGESSKDPFLLSDKLWDKMLIFMFLIAGVIVVLVYSVKALKSIGWIKSKCYIQLTTSASDINYKDYYIQFGLKDNKGKIDYKREQFENDGRLEIKLKQGQYECSVIKPEEYQYQANSVYVNGSQEYSFVASLYRPHLCGVYLSFTDKDGKPYPSDGIVCQLKGSGSFSFAPLKGNQAILLVDTSGEAIQAVFSSNHLKSKTVSLELSSRYQNVTVKMLSE